MTGQSREARGRVAQRMRGEPGPAEPAALPGAAAALPGPRTGTGRRAVLGIALVLAAVAAWRIVRTVVAPQGAISVASLLTGPDAEGSVARGERLVTPDAAAVARAEAAVRAEPLAADAYVVLALAAEVAGRDEQAARLMDIAAAWWPRHLRAQTWILARCLRLRDFAGAMARLDAIARGRPDVLDALSEAIAPALAEPAAAAALADLLSRGPPWRTRFLAIAVRQWREPRALIGLMEVLQARQPGLSAAELRPYLAKLVAAGLVERAYLAWLRSLPGDRLDDLTYLYNGRFQYPVSEMPFDWTLPPVAGAVVSVSGAAADRVLTVGFLGGRVPESPVLHGLLLAPGAYTLKGRVRTDRLRAERGAIWRIACREDAGGALARSEPFVDSTPWRDFTVSFTVPETGCQAQTLSLDVSGRAEVEKRASGTASFSALDIEPR